MDSLKLRAKYRITTKTSSLYNHKPERYKYLHTVKEQKDGNQDVVALVVFQVLHDPSSRFGHCLRFAKA